MTYKVLTVETTKILYRSHIRLATIEPNLRIAEESQGSHETLTAEPIQSYNPVIISFVISLLMTGSSSQITNNKIMLNDIIVGWMMQQIEFSTQLEPIILLVVIEYVCFVQNWIAAQTFAWCTLWMSYRKYSSYYYDNLIHISQICDMQNSNSVSIGLIILLFPFLIMIVPGLSMEMLRKLYPWMHPHH